MVGELRTGTRRVGEPHKHCQVCGPGQGAWSPPLRETVERYWRSRRTSGPCPYLLCLRWGPKGLHPSRNGRSSIADGSTDFGARGGSLRGSKLSARLRAVASHLAVPRSSGVGELSRCAELSDLIGFVPSRDLYGEGLSPLLLVEPPTSVGHGRFPSCGLGKQGAFLLGESLLLLFNAYFDLGEQRWGDGSRR